MNNEFIGRDKERRVLEDAWASKSSAFVPIYGRRRVGKSELILRFLKDHPGIYFVGKRGNAPLQIAEFLTEAAEVLHEPLLGGMAPSGWTEALTAVMTAAKSKKLVIALDEFQWLAEANPELPSILQALWDRAWQKSGNLVLILCGSYIGFMEREILGKKSPLFGRRTAQILLKPFDYREAADFHPRYSLADKARVYFLCGGMPLYLKFFRQDRSIASNIEDNFLNEHAPLYREPEFLLREELREVHNYHAILMAVTSGSVTHQALAVATGIESRALNYYLTHLAELGYLSKRYPLMGARPVPRHVRYAVTDPLLQFWFRFVYPNTSYVLQMGRAKAMKDRVLPHLDSYWGLCFERLCREALPHVYRTEGISADFEVGEYWDRNSQIDVVGLRSDGWTDLGECKWGSVRSRHAIETELHDKAAFYPNPRGATIGLRVFSRSTPRTNTESVAKWYGLEDLYKAAEST